MKSARVWFGLVLSIALGTSSVASATIVTTAVNTGDGGLQSFYDSQMSSADLVNVGQPSLSTTTSSAALFGPYTLDGLHDGSGAAAANVSYWSSSSTVVTFTLDTSIYTLGYEINSIRNINGYSSNAKAYANQTFDILYSTVAAPLVFLPLTTVSYTPFSNTGPSGASMVTLTDTTGILAIGVAAIRLNIPLTLDTGETAVFREFDLIGGPVVPEPSTAALLGLGCVGLAIRARRRSSAG